MSGKTDIERRTVLSAITAASGAALSSAVLSRHAAADPTGKRTSGTSDDFETAEIKTGDNTIFIRRYGKGSPPADGAWVSSN
jgi:haloacetate dehalogenase